MKKLTAVLLLILCLAFLSTPLVTHASGDGDIETTFNELCGQAAIAESLSVEELNKMVTRCDTLKEEITQSIHPKKKVLLFRLKKCRNFLAFIIQTKLLDTSQ